MAKRIKYTAYVVERHVVMIGERAGFKIGFQPEECEEVQGPTSNVQPPTLDLGQSPIIQIGGYFIETTDKEFFKQGIKYEVEMTITRKA